MIPATLLGYVNSGTRYLFLLFPSSTSDESLELFASEVMPHFATVQG